MSKTPLEPRDLQRTSEPIRGDRVEAARPAAVAAEPRERRRRGLGWLWWLLGLLAVAIVAALALGLFDGGEDTDGNANRPQATGGAAGSAGSLTAGGTSLLPPPAGGIGEYVGQDATGESLVVRSVVSSTGDNAVPEGFWVGGASKEDQHYVEWGGAVGSNESDFTPKVGETVNLRGPVQAAPKDPGTELKLSAADAERVKTQGAFVNADDVSPTRG